MKILVITSVLWRDDNSVGNSYSNIFANIENAQIENICCRGGISKNAVSSRCYQIPESNVFLNLLGKQKVLGFVEDNSIKEKSIVQNGDVMKNKRLYSKFPVLYLARGLIWKFGRWRTKELCNFIDDFNPDLIFAQLQGRDLNFVVDFVQKYAGKPLVVYAWDDIYSLKQISFSPIYWIDRFFQRRSVRSLVKRSSILYTIAKEQKDEYFKNFNVRTELLYKGKEFINMPETNKASGPIRLLYTGNLSAGRSKTMMKLCQYINELNAAKKTAELEIYSSSPLSRKETKVFGECFKGSVSEEEVQKLQKEADVLLHVEPLGLKGSLICRLSFSTKLVDYFYNAKCIFAIGSSRCASIKYLKRNDSAIVCESIGNMKQQLNRLLDDRKMVEEYAQKAWSCGARNHQIKKIQQKMMNDFESIINI